MNTNDSNRIAPRTRRGMPTLRHLQEGRWGYILAWLLGVPIPILVLVYLLRGCS